MRQPTRSETPNFRASRSALKGMPASSNNGFSASLPVRYALPELPEASPFIFITFPIRYVSRPWYEQQGLGPLAPHTASSNTSQSHPGTKDCLRERTVSVVADTLCRNCLWRLYSLVSGPSERRLCFLLFFGLDLLHLCNLTCTHVYDLCVGMFGNLCLDLKFAILLLHSGITLVDLGGINYDLVRDPM